MWCTLLVVRSVICSMWVTREKPLKLASVNTVGMQKNRPKNCELAKHIYDKEDHDFDRDVEISVIKMGFKNLDERKRAEDRAACHLGCITPTGINEMHALGDYAKEMYDLHQNI